MHAVHSHRSASHQCARLPVSQRHWGIYKHILSISLLSFLSHSPSVFTCPNEGITHSRSPHPLTGALCCPPLLCALSLYSTVVSRGFCISRRKRGGTLLQLTQLFWVLYSVGNQCSPLSNTIEHLACSYPFRKEHSVHFLFWEILIILSPHPTSRLM